ncbi:hypothetical protein HQ520_08615, partial [bacterium]|nr:hypothetical protein [bacterium]
MPEKRKIRVCLVGASNRSGYMFGPILKGLACLGVDLVAIWNRTLENARPIA